MLVQDHASLSFWEESKQKIALAQEASRRKRAACIIFVSVTPGTTQALGLRQFDPRHRADSISKHNV